MIGDRQFKISGDSDGVIFVTDFHGNVAEINGLVGSVAGNYIKCCGRFGYDGRQKLSEKCSRIQIGWRRKIKDFSRRHDYF